MQPHSTDPFLPTIPSPPPPPAYPLIPNVQVTPSTPSGANSPCSTIPAVDEDGYMVIEPFDQALNDRELTEALSLSSGFGNENDVSEVPMDTTDILSEAWKTIDTKAFDDLMGEMVPPGHFPVVPGDSSTPYYTPSQSMEDLDLMCVSPSPVQIPFQAQRDHKYSPDPPVYSSSSPAYFTMDGMDYTPPNIPLDPAFDPRNRPLPAPPGVGAVDGMYLELPNFTLPSKMPRKVVRPSWVPKGATNWAGRSDAFPIFIEDDLPSSSK